MIYGIYLGFNAHKSRAMIPRTLYPPTLVAIAIKLQSKPIYSRTIQRLRRHLIQCLIEICIANCLVKYLITYIPDPSTTDSLGLDRKQVLYQQKTYHGAEISCSSFSGWSEHKSCAAQFFLLCRPHNTAPVSPTGSGEPPLVRRRTRRYM